ncbi:response regulator [candidate division KSB1 bacterium]|nr:response regulator [candidate division KSB1 bacterium]
MKKNVILQIDDNLDMLLIGERTFNAAGFEYIAARSCEEGLEKLKSTSVDLIVLDYILPDINGVQFIHALTHVPEFQQTQPIPIVLLTAHPEIMEDLQDYYHYGLRAVLHKPYGHRELVDVVENILTQEQILRNRKTHAPLQQNRPPLPMHQREEFRAALATITQLSSDLKSSLAATLEEQQYMDIDAIHTTSKRLLKLLDAPVAVNKGIASETLQT